MNGPSSFGLSATFNPSTFALPAIAAIRRSMNARLPSRSSAVVIVTSLPSASVVCRTIRRGCFDRSQPSEHSSLMWSYSFACWMRRCSNFAPSRFNSRAATRSRMRWTWLLLRPISTPIRRSDQPRPWSSIARSSCLRRSNLSGLGFAMTPFRCPPLIVPGQCLWPTCQAPQARHQ